MPTNPPFNFHRALQMMFDSPSMIFSNDLGQDSVAIDTSNVWVSVTGGNTDACGHPLPVPTHSGEDIYLKGREFYECTRITLSHAYQQDSIAHMLIWTETIVAGECHICNVRLSGAVFEIQNGQWELKFKHPNFEHVGKWGTAPPIEVIEIGSNHFGYLLTQDDTSSDIGWQELIIISQIDDQFVVVFRADSATRNYSERWGYESELLIDSQSQSDSKWYDLHLITTHTPSSKYPDGLVEENVYVWDGAQYKLADLPKK